MNTDTTNSTRRSFLKGSALFAAPLAAAVPAALVADDGLKARVARLEDEAAIRELHQTWLRRVNTRTDHVTGAADAAAQLFADPERAAFDKALRGIAADHAGEPDVIEVAADGKSAAGRFHCNVDFETALAQDCTLAKMAHAQGDGFVRRTERRVLNVTYVKTGGAWAIKKIEFAPA